MPTSASRYHSAPCVAVLGGCGGAGASSLAAGLARSALRSGRAVVLVDGDPLGGGLETLLAEELSAAPADAGKFRAVPIGEPPQPPQPPRESGLTVLSWGSPEGAAIPPDAMRQALGELAGAAELLIVDLPRTLGDATRIAAAYATHSLLIVPVAERAAISSHRLLTQLGVLGPRPGLVARLPCRDLLDPGHLAKLLRLPLSGVLKAGRDRSTLHRASLDRFCLRFVDSLYGAVTA